MKFLRTASYSLLLYTVVLLLMVLGAVLLISSSNVFLSANQNVWAASSAYQKEQLGVQRIRTNLFQVRDLFSQNAQNPPVRKDDVNAAFKATLKKAREIDQAIGEMNADSVLLAFTAFYNASQKREIEGTGSDTAKIGFELAISHLDEVLNSPSILQPYTLAISEFRTQVKNLYALLYRYAHAPPLHNVEIQYLLSESIKGSILNLSGPSGSEKKNINQYLRQLMSGIHAAYANDDHITDSSNEALLQGIQLVNSRLDAALDAYEERILSMAEESKAQLQIELLEAKKKMMLLLLTGVVVGWVVVWRIIHEVQRRIRYLKGVINEIGRGDFSVRSTLNCKDELGSLSSAMNTVAQSLADKDSVIQKQVYDLQHAEKSLTVANATLEEKVFERTKELGLAEQVINSINEGVVITDEAARVVMVNPAYTQITGYSRGEIIGNAPHFLMSKSQVRQLSPDVNKRPRDGASWQGETLGRHKDGTEFSEHRSTTYVRGVDGQRLAVTLITDITERKELEERLEQMAYFDSLTQLANRALYKDRVQHFCAMGHRDGEKRALLYIDLDHFKEVNDSLGHDAGDELLLVVSKVFKRVVKRESDSIARLGGDEFAVLLDPIKQRSDVRVIAEQIVKELSVPIIVRDQEVKVGCSIGIAVYPEDGADYETLTRHADMAMYRAKDNGRNTYEFYNSELDEVDANTLKFHVELDRALEKNEFKLFYQPKWDLYNGRFAGFEALIRWQRENGDFVSPAQFIPYLEKTNRIIDVGMWVIESAMAQMAYWNARFLRPITVAVNVSAKQIMVPTFVKQVTALKQQYAIPDGALQLEITESIIMQDPVATASKLDELNKMGITAALDDFGTGFSSLSYLRQFPLHTLKIDRSFIMDIEVNADDKAIIETILLLAQKLKMHVVFEGVETQQQLQELRKLSGSAEGVLCQGFLVSAAVDRDSAEAFIENDSVFNETAEAWCLQT